MTTHRSAYIAIFVISALVAAALYYVAQPRADAVRARTDIAVLTPISADMLELVRVSPGDRPAEAATSIEAVVGQYAAMPILAGQFVDTRALDSLRARLRWTLASTCSMSRFRPRWIRWERRWRTSS